MAHIEAVKSKGKTYLRIAKSVYIPEEKKQKKIIIDNIGILSELDGGDPDYLKKLREQFKQTGKIEVNGKTYTNDTATMLYPYMVPFQENNPLAKNVDFKNFGYLFLDNLFNSLGINQVLSLEKYRKKLNLDILGLTKLMVFGRVLDPGSKRRTYNTKDDYFSPVTASSSLDDIYRTLTVLDRIAPRIQSVMDQNLRKSNIVQRKTDITYYDVTNYYFETMMQDEDIVETKDGEEVLDENGKPKVLKAGIRKRGVSKEKRSQEPIVQMGMFIDNQGIPIWYKIFPGNTQDQTTFTDLIKSSLQDISNKNKYGKIVVVADNGMNNSENRIRLVQQGNGYVVSTSLKKTWGKNQSWVQDESGYTCLTNAAGEVTFKYKSRVRENTLKYKDKTTGELVTATIKEKDVIYWSLSHFKRQAHENNKFMEYLYACEENPDKLKDKQAKIHRYFKTVLKDRRTGEKLKNAKTDYELNSKQLDRDLAVMGYYMITTSEIDSPDLDVIQKYHGLSRIEDSFRIIKSDLEGRPIYVNTEEHINAHFLTCFIALTMLRLLQYKVLKFDEKKVLTTEGWEAGLTAERIQKALADFEISTDPTNGTCLINGVSDDLYKLLDSNSIGYNIAAPTITEINKLKRNIKKANII